MINFFDRLYFSIKNKNRFLEKLRYYSLLRSLVRYIYNIVLPIYFKITSWNSKYILQNAKNNRISNKFSAKN